MKLIYRIALRLSMVLLPLLTLWAVIFYYAMVDEINDESDDSLVEYAETIIRRQLAGRPLPEQNNGSNNSYSIVPLGAGVTVEPYMTFHDEMVYIPEQQDTEPARVLTTVFTDDDDMMYRLTVAMPTFERDDLLVAVFWHILALYVVLLLTVLLVTTLVFHRSMRPLYALLGWFERYVPGCPVDPVPHSDVPEFHRLGTAADRAVRRAEEYFDRQKQFIGNASHELQTPLAVIGNRIEWLADNTALTEEQFAELSKMRTSLSGLVRLNKTLLLLTKIDNGQIPDTVDVDISAVIRREADTYSEIYAHRQITCTLDLTGVFTVSMNESLADVLVGNLIKNAFRHSPDGATVSVTLHDNILTVSNDGAEKLDSERIFDRFYHSGSSGATGLGLALVSSIGRYYKLRIGYEFRDGRHLFTVSWPRTGLPLSGRYLPAVDYVL